MKSKKRNTIFNISADNVGSINNNTGDGVINQYGSNIENKELLSVLKDLEPFLAKFKEKDKNEIVNVLSEDSEVETKEIKIKAIFTEHGIPLLHGVTAGTIVELMKLWLLM